MKRFHVHVAVEDLTASVRFYSSLFAAQPTVLKNDYAKWMLDDPRVNFAISQRSGHFGVNHLGIQAESAEELDDVRECLEKSEATVLKQMDTACCYAKSDKYWATDPQGIAWETFHTLGTVPVFGEDQAMHAEVSGASVCCIPVADRDRRKDAPSCIPTL